MFKSFKGVLGLVAFNLASFAVALDFTGANWIWIPGRAADGVTYPPGNATFRRDFYPPADKIPLSANILITTDNIYTLYVNGEEIGTGNNLTQAQRYCVPLVPNCNVFAVEAENAPPDTTSNVGNAAGVLAAIQIRYTDGFTQTLVTDGEWHGVSGPYPTTAPWNAPSLSITIPPATQNPGPSLVSASWIWTNEVDASSDAPTGARAFRKTISIPNGDVVDSMVIDIACDNEHTLYVNGLLVGSGESYSVAQRYQINFPPTKKVVIAVFAINDAGPAGLIAAAELESYDCGCGKNVFVVADGTWKYSTGTPDGFQNSEFDDSAWPTAIVEGPYGVAPWGNVAIPTSNSPQSAALSGAPSAPPASVVA